MSSNKIFNFGPVALSATLTTNILNPAITSLAGPVGLTITQPYLILHHIRIVSKSTFTVTFSLWKGATGANAAGTEVIGSSYSISGKGTFDWYGMMRFDAADFLVGGASSATSLTIEGSGEIGFI